MPFRPESPGSHPCSRFSPSVFAAIGVLAQVGLAPASVPRAIAVLAYGALPLLPMALHPAEAAPVLAALGVVSVLVMENAPHGTAWLLPAWMAAFGWVVTAAWRERHGVAERLVTAGCFVLLLLAFGLYLAFGHAVRHLLRLSAWHNPCDRAAAARWLARIAVPAGIVCAAGVAALAAALRDTTVALLMPSFRVIAALTLSHMTVTTPLEGGDGSGGTMKHE